MTFTMVGSSPAWQELGGRHAYMDADSIFVPPEPAPEIIEYFQPLNPYSLDIPLLKEEKKDAWFFGFSSKRYVLYDDKGEIRLRDYKLHGLGHLTDPFPNVLYYNVLYNLLYMGRYATITPCPSSSVFANITGVIASVTLLVPAWRFVQKGKVRWDALDPAGF